MKVIILAAGKNEPQYWPLFVNKPKCLYTYLGQVQLARVIENARHIVPEEDITIVTGYKSKAVARYIRKKGLKVKLKVNRKYKQSALYSLKTALEGVDEDVLLLLADEVIAIENLKNIAAADNGLVCLVSDVYPYYILSVFKIRKDKFDYFTDERYLSDDFLKDVKLFLTPEPGSKRYDPEVLKGFLIDDVNVHSGYAMGFMWLDAIRKIGRLKKVVRILNLQTPSEITTIPCNENIAYVKDLDRFYQTDDYKNNFFMRSCFKLQLMFLAYRKRLNILQRSRNKR